MNNNEFGAKLAKETLTGDIAAHERGNRRKAQQLITRVLVPEKMRRGI